MRMPVLTPIALLAACAALPAAAAGPKCSFDENELHSELIVYVDSGMACEADDSQRAAQEDSLRTYYAALDKVVARSSGAPASSTGQNASPATTTARRQPKGDLDAIKAQGSGQYVSKELLNAAIQVP